MSKGKVARTKERYNRLLAAFRSVGHNYRAVARLTLVDKTTAKRVYELGWPEVAGCIPIKEQLDKDALMVRAHRAAVDPAMPAMTAQLVVATTLADAKTEATSAADMLQRAADKAAELEKRANEVLEQAKSKLAEVEDLVANKAKDAETAAKATLAKAEIDARQHLQQLMAKAKVDALETMADEAVAAKFGRKAAGNAAAIAALVLNNAQKIAADLRQALDGKLNTLTPIQAIRVAREMIRLVEAAEKALILSFQAERLRVGQPTEILGVQSLDQSFEEREIKLKAVARAMEKRKSKLTLLPGGGEPGAASA